ncbi:MAG: glycosyltransferase, partial [Candidatus Bathyarchaeota archaeon]|nr:glycosyltransferase [Candidatus Bathyarchaeota archaeon]
MIPQNKGAPRASLLWLNYNSSRIINVVLKSLESLLSIDYSNYEVIVVDNGSNDGSMQAIKDFIRKAKSQMDLPPIKFVENSRNLGYTGGNYIGYRHRAKESKYVIVVNNDLVVEPGSLRSLICYLENHASAAAVQGMITSWDGSRIDNCGF